ncbi:hypothetical protein H696_04433 [Fonticula alba]|uniref:HECT domain-containing protein n=1 Tax=Fonticula alba TaxID=691883 RepID=A0A058Z531_FONAL|nr:hypothetical protein H696_04433 [Fonticula alba]KCV69013.1 hypothetical protein H696_04433 [Fonticula alba]|eukprot:XP_009496584.1 hypothetical protein H696_04433 [Fonticula alba]
MNNFSMIIRNVERGDLESLYMLCEMLLLSNQASLMMFPYGEFNRVMFKKLAPSAELDDETVIFSTASLTCLENACEAQPMLVLHLAKPLAPVLAEYVAQERYPLLREQAMSMALKLLAAPTAPAAAPQTRTFFTFLRRAGPTAAPLDPPPFSDFITVPDDLGLTIGMPRLVLMPLVRAGLFGEALRALGNSTGHVQRHALELIFALMHTPSLEMFACPIFESKWHRTFVARSPVPAGAFARVVPALRQVADDGRLFRRFLPALFDLAFIINTELPAQRGELLDSSSPIRYLSSAEVYERLFDEETLLFLFDTLMQRPDMPVCDAGQIALLCDILFQLGNMSPNFLPLLVRRRADCLPQVCRWLLTSALDLPAAQVPWLPWLLPGMAPTPGPAPAAYRNLATTKDGPGNAIKVVFTLLAMARADFRTTPASGPALRHLFDIRADPFLVPKFSSSSTGFSARMHFSSLEGGLLSAARRGDVHEVLRTHFNREMPRVQSDHLSWISFSPGLAQVLEAAGCGGGGGGGGGGTTSGPGAATDAPEPTSSGANYQPIYADGAVVLEPEQLAILTAGTVTDWGRHQARRLAEDLTPAAAAHLAGDFLVQVLPVLILGFLKAKVDNMAYIGLLRALVRVLSLPRVVETLWPGAEAATGPDTSVLPLRQLAQVVLSTLPAARFCFEVLINGSDSGLVPDAPCSLFATDRRSPMASIMTLQLVRLLVDLLPTADEHGVLAARLRALATMPAPEGAPSDALAMAFLCPPPGAVALLERRPFAQSLRREGALHTLQRFLQSSCVHRPVGLGPYLGASREVHAGHLAVCQRHITAWFHFQTGSLLNVLEQMATQPAAGAASASAAAAAARRAARALSGDALMSDPDGSPIAEGGGADEDDDALEGAGPMAFALRFLAALPADMVPAGLATFSRLDTLDLLTHVAGALDTTQSIPLLVAYLGVVASLLVGEVLPEAGACAAGSASSPGAGPAAGSPGSGSMAGCPGSQATLLGRSDSSVLSTFEFTQSGLAERLVDLFTMSTSMAADGPASAPPSKWLAQLSAFVFVFFGWPLSDHVSAADAAVIRTLPVPPPAALERLLGLLHKTVGRHCAGAQTQLPLLFPTDNDPAALPFVPTVREGSDQDYPAPVDEEAKSRSLKYVKQKVQVRVTLASDSLLAGHFDAFADGTISKDVLLPAQATVAQLAQAVRRMQTHQSSMMFLGIGRNDSIDNVVSIDVDPAPAETFSFPSPSLDFDDEGHIAPVSPFGIPFSKPGGHSDPAAGGSGSGSSRSSRASPDMAPTTEAAGGPDEAADPETSRTSRTRSAGRRMLSRSNYLLSSLRQQEARRQAAAAAAAPPADEAPGNTSGNNSSSSSGGGGSSSSEDDSSPVGRRRRRQSSPPSRSSSSSEDTDSDEQSDDQSDSEPDSASILELFSRAAAAQPNIMPDEAQALMQLMSMLEGAAGGARRRGGAPARPSAGKSRRDIIQLVHDRDTLHRPKLDRSLAAFIRKSAAQYPFAPDAGSVRRAGSYQDAGVQEYSLFLGDRALPYSMSFLQVLNIHSRAPSMFMAHPLHIELVVRPFQPSHYAPVHEVAALGIPGTLLNMPFDPAHFDDTHTWVLPESDPAADLETANLDGVEHFLATPQDLLSRNMRLPLIIDPKSGSRAIGTQLKFSLALIHLIRALASRTSRSAFFDMNPTVDKAQLPIPFVISDAELPGRRQYNAFANAHLSSMLLADLNQLETCLTASVSPVLKALAFACPHLFSVESRLLLVRNNITGPKIAGQELVTRNPALESQYTHLFPYTDTGSRFAVHRRGLRASSQLITKELSSSGRAPHIRFDQEVGTGSGPTMEFFHKASREFARRGLGLWLGDDQFVEHVPRSPDAMAPAEAPNRAPYFAMQWLFAPSAGLGPDSDLTDVPLTIGAADAAGPFVSVPDAGLYPRPTLSQNDARAFGQEHLVHARFFALGQLVGCSLLNATILELPLSAAFWRAVVFGLDADVPMAAGPTGAATSPGKPWADAVSGVMGATPRAAVCMDLLEEVDPRLHMSMQRLFRFVCDKRRILADTGLSRAEQDRQIQALTLDGQPLEALALDFTLPGAPHIELLPRGSDIPVTALNVDRYLALVIQNLTKHWSIAARVAAFRAGLGTFLVVEELIPLVAGGLMRSVDDVPGQAPMDLLLGGATESWTLEYLAEHIRPSYGFTADSPAFKALLRVLSELDDTQRAAFLAFTTGASRLPIGGLASIQPPLSVVNKTSSHVASDSSAAGPTDDTSLPSSMTCSHTLKIPNYSSEAILRERLLTAIYEGTGSFHLS